MESCSNDHEEIIFNEGGMFGGWNPCPLCEALAIIKELEEEAEMEE